ncbi:MAG: hypothetical protein JKY54_14850 [Flavobacteriales bacterium]|nr:hypothetical protein [Flavobacteriales bacterium]
MNIKNSIFSIVLISLALTACSSDEKQDDKKDTKDPVFIQHQLKALEDAKKLEATLKKRTDEQKKKIEDATDEQKSDDDS